MSSSVSSTKILSLRASRLACYIWIAQQLNENFSNIATMSLSPNIFLKPTLTKIPELNGKGSLGKLILDFMLAGKKSPELNGW